MLLNQSFAVLVRPVNSAAVVTREHPFFDPGASTSVMLPERNSTQLTATQPPLGVPSTNAVRDRSVSAIHPVQGPDASDVSTQPLQAPSAGTATPPTQAPGAGPEVLPTGFDATLSDQSLSSGRSAEIASESEMRQRWMGNQHHQLVSTSRVINRKQVLTRTSLKMPTTGRQSEGSEVLWAGIRS